MDFALGLNLVLFCYIIDIEIDIELLPYIVTIILLPFDVLYLSIYLFIYYVLAGSSFFLHHW